MKLKRIKRTPDGPIDLYEAVTRRKQDPIFDDMDDDMEPTLDDIEDAEIPYYEDEDDNYIPFDDTDMLLSILRDELKLSEDERGVLKFLYRDEMYEGVPLHEINSNKFLFIVDGKYKSFVLSEIEPL